jgi:hypothetical protein
MTRKKAIKTIMSVTGHGDKRAANLMPSCRMCNHYKRAHDLETFRRYIAEIPLKLQENYIFKIGVVYGNVLPNEKSIKFYFERVKNNDTADRRK